MAGGLQRLFQRIQTTTTKIEKTTVYKSHERQIQLQHIQEKIYQDVALCVNDKQILCHSVVLAARSSVFKSILEHEFKDKRPYFINLTATLKTSNNLVSFVNYFYGEAVHLTSNNVYVILDVATQHFLYYLTKQCEDFLFKNLCLENLGSVWYAAELFELKMLANICRFFARETLSGNASYFDGILTGTPRWFVSNFVKWSQKCQLDDTCVVNAIEQWLQDDFAARRDGVSDLLEIFKRDSLVTVLSSRLQQSSNPATTTAKGYVNLVLSRLLGSNLPKENLQISFQTTEDNVTLYLQERNSKEIVFYCVKTNSWRTMRNPNMAGNLIGVLHDDSFIFADYTLSNVKCSVYDLAKEKHKLLPSPFIKLEIDGYDMMMYVQGTSYFISRGDLFLAQAVESNRRNNKKSTPEIVLYKFSSVSETWSYVQSLPLENNSTFKCLHTLTFAEEKVVIIVTVVNSQIQNDTNGFEESSIFYILDQNAKASVKPITANFGLSITKRNVILIGDFLQFVTEMEADYVHCQPHCVSVNLQDGSVTQMTLPPPWKIISSFPQLKHRGKLNDLFPRHNIRFMEHNICCLSHIAPSMLNVIIYDFYGDRWKIASPIPLPGIDKVTLHHCYSYKPISDVIKKQEKSIPRKMRCFSDSVLI